MKRSCWIPPMLPRSNVGLTIFSYGIYVRRKCRSRDSVAMSGVRTCKKGARTSGRIRVSGRHRRSRRFDSIARAPVGLLLLGLPRGGRSVGWVGRVALPSLGPVGDLGDLGDSGKKNSHVIHTGYCKKVSTTLNLR